MFPSWSFRNFTNSPHWFLMKTQRWALETPALWLLSFNYCCLVLHQCFHHQTTVSVWLWSQTQRQIQLRFYFCNAMLGFFFSSFLKREFVSCSFFSKLTVWSQNGVITPQPQPLKKKVQPRLLAAKATYLRQTTSCFGSSTAIHCCVFFFFSDAITCCIVTAWVWGFGPVNDVSRSKHEIYLC